MLDLFIHWNVSPEAFSIGAITVRWYGILYGVAFLASYYAFRELVKYDKLTAETVERLLFYMILGTIIGARLGDCFFYHPEYYLQHPLEIFAVWNGGLSSHGGACGILVVLYLFARKINKPYIWVLDRVVVVIGVAGFFIRTGNLMNHEIYGHVTDVPWAFCFITNIQSWIKGAEPVFSSPSHPTQIYEALYYLFTYAVLRFVYRKCGNQPRPFLIFGLFLIMVFVFRFCTEFIKNPQEEFERNMLFNMGQWLSVPFILLGIVSLIIGGKRKKTEPAPVENKAPHNGHEPQKKSLK